MELHCALKFDRRGRESGAIDTSWSPREEDQIISFGQRKRYFIQSNKKEYFGHSDTICRQLGWRERGSLFALCICVCCSYKVWEGCYSRVEVNLSLCPSAYSAMCCLNTLFVCLFISFIVSMFCLVIVKTVSGLSSTTGSVKISARRFLRSWLSCFVNPGSSDQSNKSSNNSNITFYFFLTSFQMSNFKFIF